MPDITEHPTLYSMLMAEGCELDHYNTDLYVLDTPSAREVIELFESYGGKSNRVRFRSQRDGKFWFDLPFHYVPRWIHDSRPKTYAEGRNANLDAIEQVDGESWVGTTRDGRELAVRVNGTRIEVSVAPAGAARGAALAGFEDPAGADELYGVEAADFLDRAEGRTMERILELAGITRAPAPEPALRMGMPGQ